MIEESCRMDERTHALPGLQDALDAESLVLQCVRELYQDSDVSEAASKMLERLGSYLDADRTYLFDIHDDHLVNTFEWCAPGVTPEIGELGHVDAQTIERWMEFFVRGECVIVEDVEGIRGDSPLEHAVLSMQGVRSLAAAPLERDGRVVGFLGIDNPPSERIRNIASPLKTLGYFYMMTLQRLANEQQLRALSYRDELTGLNNRNRYIADIARLSEDASLGVIFLDVNDLKEVNDRYGHSRGDEVLRQCASIIVSTLSCAEVYRIGGDEFVALVSGATREEFERMVGDLKETFGLREGATDRFASVGARWSECARDAAQLIAEADEEMYRKKRAFHLDKALAGVLPHSESVLEEALDERDAVVEASASRSSILREYNMMLGVLGIGVVKYRLDEGFTIVWANDRFYELTGRSREARDSRFAGSVESLFAADPSEFARLRRIVRDAHSEGRRFDVLVRLPSQVGGELRVRIAGTCTNEHIGGSPVVYGALTDVTDLLSEGCSGSSKIS